MSRDAVRQLELHLREAFDGTTQSLLANLEPVRTEDWWRPAAGGARSILDILQHAAVAKHLFVEHTFGAATRRYPEMLDVAPAEPRALISWLREAHENLLGQVARLDDAGLNRPCLMHWGGPTTVGNVVRLAAQHDLYHAGEINHLRALLQGNDELEDGMRRRS